MSGNNIMIVAPDVVMYVSSDIWDTITAEEIKGILSLDRVKEIKESKHLPDNSMYPVEVPFKPSNRVIYKPDTNATYSMNRAV